MLNFSMLLTNSDQETIRTIRLDPYCPYNVFIRVHQRLILFPISNAFKKLNQRQHDLTHIVLKVMIFLVSFAFSNLSSKLFSKENGGWSKLSFFCEKFFPTNPPVSSFSKIVLSKMFWSFFFTKELVWFDLLQSFLLAKF